MTNPILPPPAGGDTRDKGYQKASVQKLIAACRLLLSPTAPEIDVPFSTDFTQDDEALAMMRGALDELEVQVPTKSRKR